MNELRKYGLAPNSREEAIRFLKQLLSEYEKTALGSNTTQSDEDYLRKFDDLEDA
jgi:hypothetical protein